MEMRARLVGDYAGSSCRQGGAETALSDQVLIAKWLERFELSVPFEKQLCLSNDVSDHRNVDVITLN